MWLIYWNSLRNSRVRIDPITGSRRDDPFGVKLTHLWSGCLENGFKKIVLANRILLYIYNTLVWPICGWPRNGSDPRPGTGSFMTRVLLHFYRVLPLSRRGKLCSTDWKVFQLNSLKKINWVLPILIQGKCDVSVSSAWPKSGSSWRHWFREYQTPLDSPVFNKFQKYHRCSRQ